MGTILEYWLARSLAKNALRLASGNPTSAEFDERLYDGVSRDTGLTPEEAKSLSHSLYWILLPSIDKWDSPLMRHESGLPRDETRICFKNGKRMQEGMVEAITETIVDEHGAYLDSRINSLRRAA